MDSRITAMVFALCLPLCAAAQRSEVQLAQEQQEKPEEIVITGGRAILKQMMESEKHAYDIFNKFNDDERFNINCSIQTRTGTHFQAQVCEPAFKTNATQAHAQGYLENIRRMLNAMANCVPQKPCEVPAGDGSPSAAPPVDAVIASQRPAYMRKMEQIAKEYPEFLEALRQYSEKRDQYIQATTVGKH